VTKDEYMSTLRAYQDSQDEMRSVQRTKTAVERQKPGWYWENNLTKEVYINSCFLSNDQFYYFIYLFLYFVCTHHIYANPSTKTEGLLFTSHLPYGFNKDEQCNLIKSTKEPNVFRDNVVSSTNPFVG